MKISFYLDTKKTEGNLIFISVYHRKQFRFSTGEPIDLKNWNPKEQFPKKVPATFDQRNFLTHVKSGIEKEIRIRTINKEPIDKDILKSKLLELRGISQIKGTLFSEIQNYIDTNPDKLKENTIKKYNSLLVHLKAFITDIPLNELDHTHLTKFENYLLHSKNLTNNTTHKYLQTLIEFIKKIYKKDIITDISFLIKFERTANRNDQQVIWLSKLELDKLIDYEPKQKHLQEAKDVFVFSCLTGLRFSDLRQLTNKEKSKLILNQKRISQEKTEGEIYFNPIYPALQILQKYDYQLPIGVEQNLNRNIKEVANKAGLNRIVKKVYKQGKEKIETTLELHEAVSIHTGRRTFICILLENDVHVEKVMKLSGHKDYKSFKKYVDVTDKEAQKTLDIMAEQFSRGKMKVV